MRLEETWQAMVVLLAVLAVSLGCESSGGGGEAGTLRGDCNPNGTCNEGLMCSQGICVPEEGGDTTADSGGDTTADSGGDTTADSGGDTTADTGGGTTADTGGDTTADSGGDTTADTGGSGGCGDDCPVMVEVPAGPFMMGCNEAVDLECANDERPYHQVTVPRFWIDRTEVTVGAYRACVDAGQCGTPGDTGFCHPGMAARDDYPVNCADWYEAGNYCTWAGKRLCSEAEWEKAARGTDGRTYPWGNDSPTCSLAAYLDCPGSVVPVGGEDRCTSPYGVCDLSGNVFEWVEDDYHFSYTDAPTDGSAWTTGTRTRVWRGGGWDDNALALRASDRRGIRPDYGGYFNLGIRCCR